MLTELRAQHQQIEEAILALQPLAAGSNKRIGRPPKWMASAGPTSAAVMPTPTRKAFSAATRKKMAEAQRKRWAKVMKRSLINPPTL